MTAIDVSRNPGPRPRLSVVIATHDRPVLLSRTLDGLAAQSVSPDLFEVVIVDDGSVPPVAEGLRARERPYEWRVVTQPQRGPAAARDAGIAEARGEILLLVDDDMAIDPELIASHLASHAAGAEVVLGHIQVPEAAGEMPLFERFHLRQLRHYADAMASGRIGVRGVHVCTGNVSLRRELYDRVGGFDHRLERSEDRDLGIRLELAGADLRFAHNALTVHHSDHADLDVWLGRAYRYGLWDTAIARKHPGMEIADPWRFLYRVSPLSRPLLVGAGLAPAVSRALWKPLMQLAAELDERGGQRLAMAATTLVYGLAYFTGVRDAAGSRARFLGDWSTYRRMRREEGAVARFRRAVRADHASVRRYRERYHGEHVSPRRLPLHVATKIGFQMLVGIRTMELARDLGLRGVPQAISRVLRHAYGAEIHWSAHIAPGISIVHGNGLVIGHGARIGPGCILSQNVTIGEGIDAQTRQIGTPHLVRDVHVGPGAMLLGPITVGAASKVMAGAVLDRSVPPRMRVRPPRAEIEPRDASQEERA